jgi:outer membrane receptor for monomeric catechols
MVYAMTATGHKGKAYDVTSGLKASAAFPVDPETSRTFELGTKANLFNNRMSLAATWPTRPTSRATSRTPPSCCRTTRPSTPS